MSKNVSIRGSLLVSEGGCGGCSSDQTTKPLSLGGSGCCDAGLSYDHAVAFDTSVATIGAVGAAFVDVPGLDQFTAIEFLELESSARIRLRINPTRPQLLGALALPVGGVVAGAATFTVADQAGVQVAATVNFSGATNTPALVAAAINGALAAAGVPIPVGGLAKLTGSTLIVLAPGTGPSAFVQLAAGAPGELGLGVILVRATGTASDLPDTEGLVVLQFPRSPNAPVKVQVSGVASLDIIAAGRVAA